LFGARIVFRRGVNVKITLVADDSRLIEMMMNFAVGNVGDFPGKGGRSGNVDFVGAIEEI